MKKIVVSLMCKVSLFIGFSVLSFATMAEFVYPDIVGKTFQVLPSGEPLSCANNAKFTCDGRIIISGEDLGTYFIKEGIIQILESGQVVKIELLARNNSVITAKLDFSGGPFEDHTHLFGTLPFLDNSAEKLKDWFVAGNFWPGDTITDDGRVLRGNGCVEGKWWIEDNTFFFTYPYACLSVCLDHKAYKLVNDRPLFATDAKHIENDVKITETENGTCPVNDADDDGISNPFDNCTDVSNANQRDTDDDKYGNFCDSDLNNDEIVNVLDLNKFRTAFGSSDPHADFNGDGVVNVLDLNKLREQFGGTPGPTGLMNP